MRRSGLLLFVVSNLVLVASAATRPHYGGTLRVAIRAALSSLDPADSGQPDSVARREISRLIFETLVSLDGRGRPQPALATSWQAEQETSAGTLIFGEG
jgi:ABC-type transport system substrate-binding protein